MAIDFKIEDQQKNSDSSENNSSFEGLNFFQANKVRYKDKVNFYKAKATLIASGIDMKNVYDLLIDQFSKKKHIKNLLSEIRSSINSGVSISDSFRRTGKFTQFELINLEIGEQTNNLFEVLKSLGEFYESKIALKRQLISLLTYPAIIIVITFGVLYFMLSKVVPMFSSVFQRFGSELPTSTQKILYISNNLDVISIVFLGVVSIFILLNFLINKSEQSRVIKEKLLFKIPVFGSLIKTIDLNRFCKTMSLLLNSKVQLPESLQLCSDVMTKDVFKKALIEVKQDLSLGKSFAEALGKHNIFDKKLITLAEIGEKSNRLEGLFLTLSDQYDKEVTYKAKLIGTILEPMIIVIIGAIVGTIMISMYAPMFDMAKILQPQ